MPLVSIIVPVYKAEQWLHRCVDSILAQTMTDFELLLIDDGSPDKSGEICDEYAAKDNRVRVFHKENGGVSSARNLGLDNATGEWISFVDADDWIAPLYIEDLYNHRDSDSLIIQGLKRVSDNQVIEVVDLGDKIYNEENLFEFLDKPFYGYSWGKLFSFKIIRDKNIRYDECLMLWEDNIFVYEYILAVRQVKFISGTNYFYNYVEDSLSNKKFYNPYECYLYYDKLENIFDNYKKIISSEYYYIFDRLLASAYFRSFLMLYCGEYRFQDRRKFFINYRTKKGILLLQKSFLTTNWKNKFFLFLFTESWICFDIVKTILFKIRNLGI